MTSKRNQIVTSSALAVYSALLIAVVVFKAIPTIHIGHRIWRLAGTHTGPANFVPFKTIAFELSGQRNHLISMLNLAGNIILFLPVGILAAVVFESFSWTRALLLGVASGLSCELLELIFHVGIFDVDDVMLNALGVMLGYGLSLLFHRRPSIASA
jgi:glycopeptide antibiotics resistance protein